jgi:hypothetical protein
MMTASELAYTCTVAEATVCSHALQPPGFGLRNARMAGRGREVRVAEATVTPQVRALLVSERSTLQTVANLCFAEGALLSLADERKVVLQRGIAPLDARGWVLRPACVRMWNGCREAALVADGLPSESAAVALSMLVLARQRWPSDPGWEQADAVAEAADREYERQAAAAARPEPRQRVAVAPGLQVRERQRRRLKKAQAHPDGVPDRSGPDTALPPEAAGRWPFRPVQFPSAPALGGPAAPTPAGSFGTAPRFGQGGIYVEAVETKVPPAAKVGVVRGVHVRPLLRWWLAVLGRVPHL